MVPTFEQIRTAAYHRWERRGFAHGRDFEDWTAAEQDLLFALNYQPLSLYRLDEPEPLAIGRAKPRVCRFCEMDERRVAFGEAVPAIPAALGNRSLVGLEECEECHELFEGGILAEFEAFARPFLKGSCLPREGQGGLVPRGHISVAAYKGLTKIALAVMPRALLEYFTDAIEWVNNPDHETDRGAFDGLGCYVHADGTGQSPFVALASRIEDDTPYPFLLVFLGVSGVVFQAPVPLCVRDEDHEELSYPWVASPLGPEYGPVDPACVFVPLAASEARVPWPGTGRSATI